MGDKQEAAKLGSYPEALAGQLLINKGTRYTDAADALAKGGRTLVDKVLDAFFDLYDSTEFYTLIRVVESKHDLEGGADDLRDLVDECGALDAIRFALVEKWHSSQLGLKGLPEVSASERLTRDSSASILDVVSLWSETKVTGPSTCQVTLYARVALVEHLWQLADLDALVRTSRKEAFVRARSRLWTGMGLASLHEKRLADGDEAASAAKKQKPLAEDKPTAAP